MITVLMYHQVGRFGHVDSHRATYCDIRAFRRQMAYLRAARFSILSLDQVFACVMGEMVTPRNAVHLSFDDGYSNFAQNALPIMVRRGFASSVYVVTDLLGCEAAWLAESELPPADLMDADTVRAVDAMGATVGSHTVSHARLSTLDAAALHREVAGSKARLEGILHRPVLDFCYPYGDVSRQAVASVRAAGYRMAFTCERNRVTPGMDPLLLPRHAVSYGTSLVGLWWKLHFQKPGEPLSL
jgi:peptidoglycan/xylan/chitin deacetylase (PgdA/CDA1 family)